MCDVCVVSRATHPGGALSAKEELATSTATPIPIPVPQPVAPIVFNLGCYSSSEPLKPISLQGRSTGSSSTLRAIKSGIATETWTPQQARLAHRFLPPGITVEELAAQDPRRARRYVASMQSAQRSKARKLRQILHLEEEVHTLQAASLRQLKAIDSLRSEIRILSSKNSRLALDLQMRLAHHQGSCDIGGNGHSMLSVKGGLSAGLQDDRDTILLPTDGLPGQCEAIQQRKKVPLQAPKQQEPGTVAVGFWPCWAEALSSSSSAQQLIAQAFADLSVHSSREPQCPGHLAADNLENAAIVQKSKSLDCGKMGGCKNKNFSNADGELACGAEEQACRGNEVFRGATYGTSTAEAVPLMKSTRRDVINSKSGNLVSNTLEPAACHGKEGKTLPERFIGSAGSPLEVPQQLEQLGLRQTSHKEQDRTGTISEGWELADVAQADPDAITSAATICSAG